MAKKIIRYSLIVIGISMMAIIAYQNYPYLSYRFNQKKLEKKFTHSVKLKKTKPAKKFLKKAMPTKLIIKKINFNQNIVYAKSDNNSQAKALRKGPTHYGGTALPGQLGNILIGGHYVSYTFKNLNKLTKGDKIELITPLATFKYKVIKTEVVKENTLNIVKKYGKKKERLLTLYTCVYPSRITHKRYLAIAKQYYP